GGGKYEIWEKGKGRRHKFGSGFSGWRGREKGLAVAAAADMPGGTWRTGPAALLERERGRRQSRVQFERRRRKRGRQRCKEKRSDKGEEFDSLEEQSTKGNKQKRRNTGQKKAFSRRGSIN